VAAYLSIALGLILAYARRRKTKDCAKGIPAGKMEEGRWKMEEGRCGLGNILK
jgi:hypothetical protein